MDNDDNANSLTLTSLHLDVLSQILIHVERPEDIWAVFACCKGLSLLRDDAPLPAMWILARTNRQLVDILSSAVERDRHDQVELLLTTNVRSKLTQGQLELALLQAIRLRRVIIMHQLLRFCLLSIPEAGEDELARIIATDNLVNGFHMCEIRVFGTALDDPAGVFRYMAVNAYSADPGGLTGCISYFECRSAYDPSRHMLGHGLTMLLGAPHRSSTASVRCISTLNSRLIVSCNVHERR